MIMPFANIDRLARGAFAKAAAGGRSGLNAAKGANWKGIYGTSMLARGRAKAGAYGRRVGRQIGKDQYRRAGQTALAGMRSAGRGAMRYFGASDKSGWNRVGTAALRSASGYAALNVADFVNPFGFGSIRD